jgi:hypothetical protein
VSTNVAIFVVKVVLRNTVLIMVKGPVSGRDRPLLFQQSGFQQIRELFVEKSRYLCQLKHLLDGPNYDERRR